MKTSYDKAMAELQMIVQAIESETVGVDELATKVKRAAKLIQFCQTKLRTTETDISQTFEELKDV